MLLNIRLLVYQKWFHKLSQKAGNFGAGGLKNLRAGRLWGGFTCIPSGLLLVIHVNQYYLGMGRTVGD